MVHFVSHYFCAFLSIITGIDCDHGLLYRRSSIVRVKEDRHVA
nr:putative 7 protein [Infectious bronchitis virus]